MDTMHRIKFNERVDPRLIQLSYYNSVSFAFCEVCGRSYEGGALEILPSKLSQVRLPIIQNISKQKVNEVLAFIDDDVLNKKDIENSTNKTTKKNVV